MSMSVLKRSIIVQAWRTEFAVIPMEVLSAFVEPATRKTMDVVVCTYLNIDMIWLYNMVLFSRCR